MIILDTHIWIWWVANHPRLTEKYRNCTNLETIRQVHRTLVVDDLENSASRVLRIFNRISNDVDAALNQQTSYNQRLALRSVMDRLLCGEIISLKNEQDPSVRRLANLADVKAAIRQAFISGGFFFADIQNNQVDPDGLAILRFIAAQGEGAIVTRQTLLEEFCDRADPSAEATNAARSHPSINLLLQRELIEEVDNGYRFQVELIRLWFANLDRANIK